MEEIKHITGNSEEEIWQQVTADLNQNPELMQYQVLLHQQNKAILLDIDIDFGGGFEGGYATTIFSGTFHNPNNFKFAIHEESFFDDLGKFFGMQDVRIGYPEFDSKLIVKTNDEGRVRTIFTDNDTRNTILTLTDFTFEIVLADTDSDTQDSTLELIIEEGITDPARLREVYHIFFSTLNLITPSLF